jgi:hypothetical protein
VLTVTCGNVGVSYRGRQAAKDKVKGSVDFSLRIWEVEDEWSQFFLWNDIKMRESIRAIFRLFTNTDVMNHVISKNFQDGFSFGQPKPNVFRPGEKFYSLNLSKSLDEDFLRIILDKTDYAKVAKDLVKHLEEKIKHLQHKLKEHTQANEELIGMI